MKSLAVARKMGAIFLFSWSAWTGLFVKADCVWIKNSSDRQFGIVVGESETEIQLADRLEKENQMVQTIAKSEVLFLLKTIDLNRLEMLTHRTPRECLHYAEELLQYPEDPLARELARHLLAVALEFGNAAIAESAIRQIEVHPDFIVDQAAWREVCDSKITSQRSRPRGFSLSDEQRRDVQALLRALRREEWDSAKTSRENLRTTVSELPGPLGWREIEQALDTKAISDYLLARILRTELLLSSNVPDLERSAAKSWNDSVHEFFAGPLELPSVSKALGVDSFR